MSHKVSQSPFFSVTGLVLGIAFAVIASELTVWAGEQAIARAEDESLDRSVASSLIRNCLECHRGEQPAGGLALDSAEGLRRGGDSGSAVDLELPDESLLLLRVIDGDMPPEERGQTRALAESEVSLLRDWVKQGAPWPSDEVLDYFAATNEKRAGRDWWSLQPVSVPEIPTISSSGFQASNPIDAFVLDKLVQQGLEPAPLANRRTLIKRLYFDLFGLSPSHEVVEAFANDPAPDAWCRLVDRSLASPEYGERWGRYWLDLARYADTSGYERDQEKPFAWKYRDWVIAALNRDLSYADFLTWQIAGDEIPETTEESFVATGLLRLGTWNDEPNDKAEYQYERLEDLVHTTSTAFLGFTVKCARCHDHKFDPITQEDYYRLASVFWTGPLGPERDSKLLGGPAPNELDVSEVLAWTDVRSDPPDFRLLKQGEIDKPAQVVVPAPLSSIPKLFEEFEDHADDLPTRRRLQLAEWMVHPENPLVDRVLVNRLWQHHFGKAIVRTPNNFGFLADPPTHPHLLDWLAREFQENGRSMKHIHRLILTSRTWMAGSVHPKEAEYRDVDPDNRLWWRAERRRLDAESLRDQVLAAADQLNRRMNGVGFKQEIEKEALTGLSMKESAWTPSDESAQRRRSIYMYLKRALLPPMMTTFDLCDATASCGQRSESTVTTQALAMLNHSFMHRNSQALADQIARVHHSDEYRVQAVFKQVLSRPPDASELRRARDFLHSQESSIHEHLKTQTTGQYSKPASQDELSLRLHLRADRNVALHTDSKKVVRMDDRSVHGHHAVSPNLREAPTYEPRGINGQPALHFSGNREYLKIEGNLLDSADCTIIVVAADSGGDGHREIISNWNGAAGNSTTSLFLGLTDANRVRFSDAISNAGELDAPQEPFILTATNGLIGASVHCNGRPLIKTGTLPSRRLDTPWVIGTQGNIGGEFWAGRIAEIRVYGRALGDVERIEVERELTERYTIPYSEPKKLMLQPRELALASLIQVLMNTNEFLYVD